MENYKSIAIQYLKLNKRRSILTILGTSLTVMFLYIVLNVCFSYLDLQKADCIKYGGDYEMVFYTETPEQINQISSDPIVTKAYVGGLYLYNEEENVENALFVKGDSPWRMEKNFEYLTKTYGIEGELNLGIAAFYMQGDESSLIYIFIIVMFLLSFIFAIFGVGVIRNSIRLSLFEQIKDYGNLRCIGASIGQLRAIIYLQGAILETGGLAAGVLIGQILMSLVSVFIPFDMRFHIIPVILIAIAYYGDLYFAMEENCKLVTGMTPVSALRGEFRIKKEKIKIRKSGLIGKIFGVEGDYAYKNLMRSPGRFYKSIGAMFLGITALIVCLGAIKTATSYQVEMDERYRYYSVYYEYPKQVGITYDEIQKELPSVETLKEITEIEAITDAKRMYASFLLLTDTEDFVNHLDETYYSATMPGQLYERYEEAEEKDKEIYGYFIGQIPCYGYDETDYARYEDYLVEGTLDVSENGILVVNGTKTFKEDDGELLRLEFIDTTITDYKLGDTIEVVDPILLEEMVQKRIEEEATEEESENMSRVRCIIDCKKELIEQGKVQTYVIEGILSADANHMNDQFSFIFPLERYFEVMGADENCVTGMQYHIGGKLSQSDIEKFYYFDEEIGAYYGSEYVYMLVSFETATKTTKGILAFILFIATISSVNIINTTASNIHMRRKEFAQLRVIGVSKKRLVKMVMLEGVIMALIANLLGIIVGCLFTYGIHYYLNMILGVRFYIPWGGILLGIVLSVSALCGSVYVPLMSMKQDLAGDLAASGE